jgi:hypothetical protein
VSIDFLKNLLDLARDVVAVEQVAEPLVKEELGKAALTELFEEAKNDKTHIMVERLVNDIDEIVRLVRFDGWQNTHAGESEVKLVLRKTLFKYKLHQDQDCQGRSESVPAVLIVSVGKTNLPLSEMGFRGKVIPPKTDTDFWEYQYSTRKEQPANSWLYEITYEGQRFSIYVPHEVMEGKPAPKRLIVRVGVPE